MQSKYLFSFVDLVQGQPPCKKAKFKDLKPVIFDRLNSCLGKAKPITLKCLLDIGASGSPIANKHNKKLRLKKTAEPQTVWTTPGGKLQTTYKCQSTFILPEFLRDGLMEWDLHVSTTLGAYDMIIGRNILLALGIHLIFQLILYAGSKLQYPWKTAQLILRKPFT